MPHILTWYASDWLDVFGGIGLTLAVLLVSIFINNQFLALLYAATYLCCPSDKKYEREPVPVVPIPNTRTVPENAPVARAGEPVRAQELRQY